MAPCRVYVSGSRGSPKTSGTRRRHGYEIGSTPSSRSSNRLRRLEELHTLERCLIVPALEPGWRKAFFVCGGGICAVRSLPPGAAARLQIDGALALCQSARSSATSPLTPEQAEDLLLLDGFVRRPPPELAVLPLQREQILAYLSS